jgi:hypothetical protein
MYPVTSDNLNNIRLTLDVRTAGTSTNPEGLPAEIDGDVQYEVLEGDVEVVPTDGTNGKEVLLVSNAPNTVNRIRVFADKRLGEETVLIEDEIVYTVTAAEAAGFGFSGVAETK